MTWPALVGIALLPYVTFGVGAFVMGQLSGRRDVLQRLKKLPDGDRKPLNQRLRGYDLPAVKRLWGALALDPNLLLSEERSLRLDLVFPLLYGTAFATSLFLAWGDREPSVLLWLLLPVVILILADWRENLMQLKQLRLYRQAGPDALMASGIQVASRATITKLLLFIGCHVLLLFVLLSNV